MAATGSIRGYLPIRLTIKTSVDAPSDDVTFLYVKEHQEKESGSSASDTLFVTNAPIVPLVRTRLLLQALFGRFGDVKRVTVVDNPRKMEYLDEVDAERSLLWTNDFSGPSFLPPCTIEGSFAHVVFTSSKEMKRAVKSLQKIMSSSHGRELPGLEMESIEIQTLADASERQRLDEEGADQDEGHLLNEKPAILTAIERYRSQTRQLSRAGLLDEANNFMEEFEDAEDEARQRRAAAMNTVDEDGFVTVSYSSQLGSKVDLEQRSKSNGPGDERRRKGQKRNRKKKQGAGAAELSDFYRFQTKVNRKKTVHELRERFEEDLAKLKKMKEDTQLRPF